MRGRQGFIFGRDIVEVTYTASGVDSIKQSAWWLARGLLVLEVFDTNQDPEVMAAHEALEQANIFPQRNGREQGRDGRSTTMLKGLTGGDFECPAVLPSEKGSTGF